MPAEGEEAEMNKHNEGKWAAAEWGDAIKVESIQRTPGLPIVDVVAMCSGPNKKANARLIAAAPDLLTLAQEIAKTFGKARIADQAREVIAKATGVA
jgi:hypothetical protein